MGVQCPSCGNEGVVVLASSDIGTPTYCNKCESLWVDDSAIHLPEAIKKETRSVMDASSAYAEQASGEIYKDPEIRVKHYFMNVFKSGFTEGFIRAYAHFKNLREGRMKRIRELWNKGEMDEYKVVFMMKDLEDIQELNKLIQWK
jgi:Zn-finger nucleic acid-binding protein